MGARSEQLLEPLVVLPEISFLIAFVLERGKYFSKNHFLKVHQSEVTSAGSVWYQSFALSSKEKGRAKAFTASSSPPILLVVAQITSKSLMWLMGFSPGLPQNFGRRTDKLYRVPAVTGSNLLSPGPQALVPVVTVVNHVR
ncbi:hypothetical protein PIB30_050591 [Stylosanthes scabra]|uniref:Uncharacterized protein n=1 Tax=Stylosanthes scabra TaxID=79078 RepID=A0ABU6UIH2_9FABA|nr:hypothetical protein [Stylosanthes scabra]